MFLCKSTQNYYFPFSGYNFWIPSLLFPTSQTQFLKLSVSKHHFIPRKEGAFLKSLCAVELPCIKQSTLAICDFNLLVYMIKGAENPRVFAQIPKRGGPVCLFSFQNAVPPRIPNYELEFIFLFQRRAPWAGCLKGLTFAWRPPMPGSLGVPEATLYF